LIGRREFLSAAAAAAPPARAQSRRPNFLFLIADDHAGYVLGAAGNPKAVTPHLDRLASEGTRFASHFCNSPVCTPSRQSLLSGLLPHAAGVTRLPTPLSEEKTTLADRFREAGYRTAVFGKMHFNRPGKPGLHGFETCMTEREIHEGWLRDVKPREIPTDIAVKPPWRPFKDPARVWLNAEKRPYPRFDGEMRSDYCVRQALDWLGANQSKPFAVWVSLQEPHSPFDFPIEYRDRLSASNFPAPAVGPEDAWQIPLIFRDLSNEEKSGIIAAYYTSTMFLDHNLGRVLNRLRELRLDENTMVVYLADHGYSLGQHGRFEKHCGYDPAMHVPLIIRWPGKVRAGVVDNLTEHCDVPATITDMMDLKPLPNAQGLSLKPYLTGRDPEVRSTIFCEYLENEEVFARTKRWKYIYCSGKRRRGDGYETDNPAPGRYHRLYDLVSDPNEWRDVAARHPDVVAQLQTAILDRYRRTHPDAEKEPSRASKEDLLDFYVRPRDVS
jgi:arylsulfatase A-like enzyme